MTKRLQQELMTLMTSGQKGISAFPEGDKLFAWVATVEGPQESVYAGESPLHCVCKLPDDWDSNFYMRHKAYLRFPS